MLEQQLKSVTLIREDISVHQKALDRLIALAERYSQENAYTPTIIPFLSIRRTNIQTPIIPTVLTPSFCLILQGTKKVHLGQDIIYCYPGNYLASVIDIPACAQVIATTQSPYVGLRIDFTTQDIASVIMEAEINVKPKDKKLNIGAFIGKCDAALLDLFIRLLMLIDKPKEAPFLSALIKREMIYILLSGDYGHLFFQQVFFVGLSLK